MAVDAPAAAAPANAPEDKEDTDLEDEQNNISDEPIVSPVDAIAAFTASMAATARHNPMIDASCAVPALLGVVAAPNSENTMLQATKALCALLRKSVVNRASAHDADAVPLMVSLLPSHRLEGAPADVQPICAAAAEVLCHVSAGGNADHANRVRIEGAIPALVDATFSRMAEDPTAAYWAAGTLEHLAAADNACRAAVTCAEGCLSGLVHLVDYGVPWIAGIDSPRRTSQPTEQHKKAAARAARALLAVMVSEEGASAVGDAVRNVSITSPRIGQAISVASKQLLALLQGVARERLHVAQTGKDPEELQAAIAFSRAVEVPKSESGAARQFFKVSKQRTADMKKHPWRYSEVAPPSVGYAIPQPTPSPRLRAASPGGGRGRRRPALRGRRRPSRAATYATGRRSTTAGCRHRYPSPRRGLARPDRRAAPRRPRHSRPPERAAAAAAAATRQV